eukprot:g3552.t1
MERQKMYSLELKKQIDERARLERENRKDDIHFRVENSHQQRASQSFDVPVRSNDKSEYAAFLLRQMEEKRSLKRAELRSERKMRTSVDADNEAKREADEKRLRQQEYAEELQRQIEAKRQIHKHRDFSLGANRERASNVQGMVGERGQPEKEKQEYGNFLLRQIEDKKRREARKKEEDRLYEERIERDTRKYLNTVEKRQNRFAHSPDQRQNRTSSDRITLRKNEHSSLAET